ncbi:MAG: hydrogenase nickel incorporation protein HypB [Rhodoferax sp.]|uniref:hydrogenase nickel incorporation protein HypB n=1 Tax=Rhodoferax sp. TaxID=50421 RepID=UPI002732B323|nr:hydrogenase nickel incorporation protein HypB [Rhodoferax sp.]MDP2678636.1 hydrogenase nickel incorporation protein HypB [Rhodoferax sp.]
MCVVCGCSNTGATPSDPNVAVHPTTGDLHFGAGVARVSVPGMSQARAIKLETDVLGANNAIAAQNRSHFVSHDVTAYNLVSSPGSGKTTLLCATIEALKKRHPDVAVAVIEGDQQTSFDADRIRATGAPAIQVNTGKGCHLDAPMVAEAFSRLDLHAKHHHAHEDQHHDHAHGHGHEHSHGHPHDAPALLFIENVGNLVCPAMWDLGETAKVAILSVTEGEDKPLKYPDMFAAAKLMILNKIDLLPHVSFDVARCIEYARRVNPTITILQLSATTGEGMETWLDWLLDEPAHHHHASDARQTRIAQLEAELAQLKAEQA